MNSRVPARLIIALLGAWRHFTHTRLPQRPANPRRILIAHQLLLGDTLMLTPLIAKLRRNHPQAQIHLMVSPALAPLYATRPYGVIAHAFDMRDRHSLFNLLRVGGFDLAILPAENRLAWLARAAGARWITAFDGEAGRYKNFPIDELRPFARTPKAWGELACELADGEEPAPYDVRDWPAPPCHEFALPEAPYAVLHVGASSRLRYWSVKSWQYLATWLTTNTKLKVIFSCGYDQQSLIREIDPEQTWLAYAGDLDLTQLWNLLSHAKLLISLETGVIHMAHQTLTPSVVLYGPGNPDLFGCGKFWSCQIEEAVFQPNFPCRNENIIFRRRLEWGEFCGRKEQQCGRALCMETLRVEQVIQACRRILLKINENVTQ